VDFLISNVQLCQSGERYEDVHIRYLAENNRIAGTLMPFEAKDYPSEF